MNSTKKYVEITEKSASWVGACQPRLPPIPLFMFCAVIAFVFVRTVSPQPLTLQLFTKRFCLRSTSAITVIKRGDSHIHEVKIYLAEHSIPAHWHNKERIQRCAPLNAGSRQSPATIRLPNNRPPADTICMYVYGTTRGAPTLSRAASASAHQQHHMYTR